VKYIILAVTVLLSFTFKNNALAIELVGLNEIKRSHNRSYSGSESVHNLTKIELALNAQVYKQLSAEVVLMHEDNNHEIDVAALNLALNDDRWILTAGQVYLPFGSFDSNMISDPFTLELAETRKSAIQVSYKNNNFVSVFYIFNGKNKQNNGIDDTVDNFGFNLKYKTKQNSKLTTGISYINDIGDSNSLQDVIESNQGNNNVRKHVAGIGMSAVLEFHRVKLIAEYISAIDNFASTELAFNGQGAKPSAANIEAGYDFTLSGKPATFAVAFQITEQALGLDIPKSSLSTALTLFIMKKTSLAFEFSNKNDYSTNDGGTDKTSKSLTAKFAIEF